MNAKQARQFEALLFPGQTVLSGFFDCIEIAENEIAVAGLGARDNAKGGAVFRAAFPTAPLRGKAPKLYRAHVRELIARVKAGEPLAPITSAELLALFSDTSYRAPLTRVAAATMERLFAACGFKVEGSPQVEPWPGAVEETLADLRRKARTERQET